MCSDLASLSRHARFAIVVFFRSTKQEWLHFFVRREAGCVGSMMKMETGFRNSQSSFPVQIAAFDVGVGVEISALYLMLFSAHPVGSCPVLHQATYKTRETRKSKGYQTWTNCYHQSRDYLIHTI